MSFVLALTVALLLPAPDKSAGQVWVWPLYGAPVVVRGFDPPPPLEPWRQGHRGVDLAAVAGAPVRSSGAGTIGFAGPLAGRGVVVVLHAGGLRTTYEPVLPTVRLGQLVAPGQAIGTLLAGGSHCPPRSCLHWGLLRGTTYLDPLLLVGREDPRRVRLLPWLTGPSRGAVQSWGDLVPRAAPSGPAAESAPPRTDASRPPSDASESAAPMTGLREPALLTGAGVGALSAITLLQWVRRRPRGHPRARAVTSSLHDRS
jgi:murein DD-endopeptidase MepM/ murein hydrolase activator NlpD